MLSRRSMLAGTGLALSGALAPAWAQQSGEKIKFGLAGQSMNATIPRFMDELGLFRQQGLDVDFVVLDSASGAMTALLAKSVKFALSGPGELVSAQAQGQNVISIFNTYMGLGGSLVLSKAVADKAGLTPSSSLEQRLKVLEGLTIAAPSPTSTYAISYRTAAESVGTKTNFTYMAQPMMASALQAGAIQGYVASAPAWVPPILAGTGVKWIDGPAGDLPAKMRPRSTAVILTMKETADADRATVLNFVAAFNAFIDLIEKRPDDVRAAVAKIMPQLDAKTLELVMPSELVAWKAKPLTTDDLEQEINYVRAFAQSSGRPLPQIDKVTPATLVFK